MDSSSVFLFILGSISSIVNTFAGGGGIITLIGFLMLGVSPVEAVANNLLVLFCGGVVINWKFREQIRWFVEEVKGLVILVIYAVMGSSLGVWCLSQMEEDKFARLIPVFLVLALVGLLFRNQVEKWTEGNLLGYAELDKFFMFLGGFYTGYFASGAGIVFLFFLGLTRQNPRERLVLKNLIVWLSEAVAAGLVFLLDRSLLDLGLVMWVILGGIFGSCLSSSVFHHLPDKQLKVLMNGLGVFVLIVFVIYQV